MRRGPLHARAALPGRRGRIDRVEAGAAGAELPRIVVHVDRGGDAGGAVEFFARLADAGFTPDELAVSYYPWWHGEIDALRGTLHALAARFHRPLLVAETAFPWSTGWADTTRNLVGEGTRLAAGFAATLEDQ
jgi:arabinogalactan endo-1,4-beta-galactosidase